MFGCSVGSCLVSFEVNFDILFSFFIASVNSFIINWWLTKGNLGTVSECGRNTYLFSFTSLIFQIRVQKKVLHKKVDSFLSLETRLTSLVLFLLFLILLLFLFLFLLLFLLFVRLFYFILFLYLCIPLLLSYHTNQFVIGISDT